MIAGTRLHLEDADSDIWRHFAIVSNRAAPCRVVSCRRGCDETKVRLVRLDLANVGGCPDWWLRCVVVDENCCVRTARGCVDRLIGEGTRL